MLLLGTIANWPPFFLGPASCFKVVLVPVRLMESSTFVSLILEVIDLF